MGLLFSENERIHPAYIAENRRHSREIMYICDGTGRALFFLRLAENRYRNNSVIPTRGKRPSSKVHFFPAEGKLICLPLCWAPDTFCFTSSGRWLSRRSKISRLRYKFYGFSALKVCKIGARIINSFIWPCFIIFFFL